MYGAEKVDPMTWRRRWEGDVRGGDVTENTETVCVRLKQTYINRKEEGRRANRGLYDQRRVA